LPALSLSLFLNAGEYGLAEIMQAKNALLLQSPAALQLNR